MTYWRLHFHVVRATRNREAALSEGEADLVGRVAKAAWDERGVIVHAVGTMPDHVHVAASIPPVLSVAEVVRRWKGSPSHLINAERDKAGRPLDRFAWQAEYGAVSFGAKALADVIAYVEHQPQRHQHQTIWAGLERTDRERSADWAGLERTDRERSADGTWR